MAGGGCVSCTPATLANAFARFANLGERQPPLERLANGHIAARIFCQARPGRRGARRGPRARCVRGQRVA